MQFVTPYKTLKHCEPPLREKSHADIPQTTLAQRKRGVIHALARTQSNGSRTTVEQPQVPSFAGFHASISKPVEKSKAYYHMTYPDPPNKTVLNDVMCKLAIAIEEKNMPFALLVGDQPVYVHLVDLKSANATNISKILPFMGPFHIQLFSYHSYMLSTSVSKVQASQMFWLQLELLQLVRLIRLSGENTTNVPFAVYASCMRH